MLEGFAKEQLGDEDMSKVALQLTFDLELGEELERIYIVLEQAGG